MKYFFMLSKCVWIFKIYINSLLHGACTLKKITELCMRGKENRTYPMNILKLAVVSFCVKHGW